MKVYPHPDRRVRDPRTRAILTAEGREVPESDFYWLRLLSDGDVSLEPNEATAAALQAPAADESRHSPE